MEQWRCCYQILGKIIFYYVEVNWKQDVLMQGPQGFSICIFKGQVTERSWELIQAYNCLSVLFLVNPTHEFRLLDLTINASIKYVAPGLVCNSDDRIDRKGNQNLLRWRITKW